MYIAPWQVFAGGCVIGTLISFIVLATIIFRAIGKIGFIKMQNDVQRQSNSSDTLSKLVFILLTKGFLSDADNYFMLDKISFKEWKESIEKEFADLEREEPNGDNRDQQ